MTIETGDSSTPNGYNEFITDLKQRVRTTQFRMVRAANTELLRLFWSVGNDIVARQRDQGWGAKVVDRISADMRREFPGQRGWSRRNLLYMRKVAEVWPTEPEFVHQPGAQLPWRHVTVLLDKLHTRQDCEWYAAKAVENGWSRASLEFEIKTDLKSRLGSAPSNFATTLDAADSDLAQQVVKDKYVFEHVDTRQHVAERDREQALMARIELTLVELGRGLAFAGRQVRFDVAGDEFFIDLLFFHIEQLRYVVIELKAGKFSPAHMGQLGFYVQLVETRLKKPGHEKTVGILLCAERNDETVALSLSTAAAPTAVALYDGLTPEEQAALPSAAELEAVVRDEIRAYDRARLDAAGEDAGDHFESADPTALRQ
jgi:predicted nuclease of restriction endonuclease-like (RecB) superfamily